MPRGAECSVTKNVGTGTRCPRTPTPPNAGNAYFGFVNTLHNTLRRAVEETYHGYGESELMLCCVRTGWATEEKIDIGYDSGVSTKSFFDSRPGVLHAEQYCFIFNGLVDRPGQGVSKLAGGWKASCGRRVRKWVVENDGWTVHHVEAGILYEICPSTCASITSHRRKEGTRLCLVGNHLLHPPLRIKTPITTTRNERSHCLSTLRSCD